VEPEKLQGISTIWAKIRRLEPAWNLFPYSLSCQARSRKGLIKGEYQEEVSQL
jgi:hypothetical protein